VLTINTAKITKFSNSWTVENSKVLIPFHNPMEGGLIRITSRPLVVWGNYSHVATSLCKTFYDIFSNFDAAHKYDKWTDWIITAYTGIALIYCTMWHGRKQVICQLLQLFFEIIKQCGFISVRTFCPTNSSPHGCFAPWMCGKRFAPCPSGETSMGESSMGRNVYRGANRPCSKTSTHGAKCPWGSVTSPSMTMDIKLH